MLGTGLAVLLASCPLVIYGLGMVGLAAAGIWAAGAAETVFGSKDASVIVIDEIAGILVTYFALPIAVLPMVVGFGLFRLFDIWKPWPQLERLPGGWGVMLDDLFAGLLAHVGVRLLLLFT